MIGNGVTDWRIDTSTALMDFAYTHQLYPLEIRARYEKFCLEVADDEKCNVVQAEIQHLMEGINIYDIYGTCYVPKEKHVRELYSDNKAKASRYPYTPWLFRGMGANQHQKLNDAPPCIDLRSVETFFNKQEIIKALKVKEGIKWDSCSEDVGNNYSPDFKRGSLYLYPKLIISKLKIFIFSGDADGAVPINGTLAWINNLNLPLVSEWKSWLYDGQVAGYTSTYQGLKFVSFKGIGHTVPMYTPNKAFFIYSKFLTGEDV